METLPNDLPDDREQPPISAEELAILEEEQVQWGRLDRGEIQKLPDWLLERMEKLRNACAEEG